MNEYDKQAKDFLKSTGTEFKAEFLKYGSYFEGEEAKRDIYKITLKRGNREYSFNFGQSLNCSGRYKVFSIDNHFFLRNKEFKAEFEAGRRLFNRVPRDLIKNRDYILNKNFEEPRAYDVLSGLDVFDGDFKEFCACYGYSNDSIKANKIFNAVIEQSKQIKILWNDEELKQLQQIQ